MPNDEPIFGDLIGRSGAKAILRSALRTGEVDVLLSGKPGSGKSVALLCIEESVPGSRKADASSVSRAKLRDILSSDPPIILLDEIDDARPGVYEALSEPVEDRRVTKSVTGNEIDMEIRTQFFAASNATEPIPEHIVDRFQVVDFPEYTPTEFVLVCSGLLPKVVSWVESSEDARIVSEACLAQLDTKDVRTARDLARLAGCRERVEGIARAMQDPEANVESDPITPKEVAVLNEEPHEDADTGPFGGVSIPPGEDPREALPDEVIERIESALEQSGRRPTDKEIRSVVNGTSEDS